MDRHQEGQRRERHTGQSHKGEDPPNLGEMLTDCLVPSTRPSFWNGEHGRKLSANGEVAWTSINSLAPDPCGALGITRQDPPALSKESREECEKRGSVCSFAREPFPGKLRSRRDTPS